MLGSGKFETNTFQTDNTTTEGRRRQSVAMASFVDYIHTQNDAQPLEIFHDFR